MACTIEQALGTNPQPMTLANLKNAISALSDTSGNFDKCPVRVDFNTTYIIHRGFLFSIDFVYSASGISEIIIHAVEKEE